MPQVLRSFGRYLKRLVAHRTENVVDGLKFLWLEITGKCQLPIDRTTGRHAEVVMVPAVG